MKILLTGGLGFLGRHVHIELLRWNYKDKDILCPSSKEVDFRIKEDCLRLTKDIDIVIHMAVNGGGIGKNMVKPAEIFYDNAKMGLELIEACRINKVKKVVTIGSVCEYPKFAPIPFKEKDLWNGYPEDTNAGYGLSKKFVLVMGQQYRKQYGMNIIHLLPTNFYGMYDNFDPKESHVIAALIKRIIHAKEHKLPKIVVWGTGKATREFMYIEDAAKAIVMAMEKYDGQEPVNLSGGNEVSVKNLVDMICKEVGYKGKIVWDKTKLDGQPKRKVDGSRALKKFGFQPETSLKDGLSQTINWYSYLSNERKKNG